MSMPDPDQVCYELQEAIRLNKRPCIMLKEFLESGTVSANILSGQIFGNKRALALLTSPQGRKWVHLWIEDFLNYLQIMSVSK